MSDSDPLRNETLLTAAGRTIQIHEPLDEIRDIILDP
jgi:hypothetical protein